jgi:hypothetical protein
VGSVGAGAAAPPQATITTTGTTDAISDIWYACVLMNE